MSLPTKYDPGQNERIILPLSFKIKELVNNYSKAEPLFYADIAGAIYRTSKNTRKKIRHRKFVPLSSLLGISGGILPSFWFRRHINQVFNDVFSTCQLYLRKENDLQTLESINQIIQYINENRENLTSKKKSGTNEKFRLTLDFVSIILGFITLSGLLSFSTQINEYIASLTITNQQLSFSFVFITANIATIVLEIPILWFINRYRWYNRVMKEYDFKNKERDIYDHLILMQKSVINRFYPRSQIKLEE